MSRKSIGFPLWDAETPKVGPAAHPAIAVTFHLHQAQKFQSALCFFEAKRMWRIELFISYLVMQNQLNSILCIVTELSGYTKTNMEYGSFKQLQIIKVRRCSRIRILHSFTFVPQFSLVSECDDVCKVSSCDLQADKAVTSETDLVDNHEERAWVLYMIHCISHGMCNNVPLLPLCLDAAKKNKCHFDFCYQYNQSTK